MAKTVQLTVNGQTREITSAPDTPLIYVLRNELNLKGTRFGCGLEQCGSCMVLINGEPAQSCAREVGSLDGAEITSIEALGDQSAPHPLQQAFLEEQAGQCGYCLTGILISAKALLERNPEPQRHEIIQALDGHICRCGAHGRIIRAVEKAAAVLQLETSS